MFSPKFTASKPTTTRGLTGLFLSCGPKLRRYTLPQAHVALVTAMGWEGIHLYAFHIENSIYVEDSSSSAPTVQLTLFRVRLMKRTFLNGPQP